MKRFAVLVSLLMISMLFVFADTHLGRTENSITDSSFIVQGYYKGEKESTSVTLTFKDINNQTIIHSAQSSEGTKVNASDSHIGSNTGTIFSWTMEGSFNKNSSLKFTFSVLQAAVNGIYYRPTYTLKMTINETRYRDYSSYTINDTFYTNVTNKTQVVGGGSTTGTKASQNTEFSGSSSITYQGKTGTSSAWVRSGVCTLNISDYEQEIPGSYHYSCWVIAEYSIE